MAAMLTSGCQTTPVITESGIVERDARLAGLKPWRALGSLVVDSEQQGVVNASFTWEAKDSGFDIRLIGPLGLKTYRITEENGQARVTGDNQEFTAGSAEAALLDAIGVRVPLKEMQDWVVGLQGAAIDAKRDRQGRIRNMLVADDDQIKWAVKFQRYAKVDSLELPRQILVTGNNVEIRMSIRSWSRPEILNENRLTIPTAELN